MDVAAMTDADFLLSFALPGGGGFLIGAVAGLCYFASLWWNVGLFARGGALLGIVVQASRFAAIAGVFFVLAKFGAVALLSGALGLLFSRRLLLRRLGEAK
jgi:hypothetical protein